MPCSGWSALHGVNLNWKRNIALLVISGSIKKLFLIDFLNTYLFSIFFFNSFCQYLDFLNIFFQRNLLGEKVWGYPTLRELGLINFNRLNISNKLYVNVSLCPYLIFSYDSTFILFHNFRYCFIQCNFADSSYCEKINLFT